MLRQDVIDAVSARQFHIYPVQTNDECVELLTGWDSGERDAGGQFPPGSINGRIFRHLMDFADQRRPFSSRSEQSDME